MRLAVSNRALSLSFVLLAAASAMAQRAELVTINRAGTASGHGHNGSRGHYRANISPDGRFVLFSSGANDLVPNDTNGHTPDAYMRDTQTGVTTLISVNRFGTGPGNDSAAAYAITSDRRFVLFGGRASDLVPNDTNGRLNDVFIRDLETNTTTLVSVRADGGGSADAHSYPIAITPDGNIVLFASDASNLVAGTTTRGGNIYSRDLHTGVTTLVNVNRFGTASANGSASQSLMSDDGRFVFFESQATDLVANDFDSERDVFVRDLQTGVTSLVSVNLTGSGSGNGTSSEFTISADGRFVAFKSYASDITANDTNLAGDVFVRDLQAGTTQLVSVNRSGTSSGGYDSRQAQISADGRFVAFIGYAADLVTEPTDNDAAKVLVRDLQAGTTKIATFDPDGRIVEAAPNSYLSISGDGRFVAFWANDPMTGVYQIFVRDCQANRTTIASRRFDRAQGGDLPSINPDLSRDGRIVVFSSFSTDLVRNDTNGNSDLFIFRLDGQPVEPSANLPPSVTLTAPADFTWIEPTPNAAYEVTLTADATDADGSVARVDFYANAVLVGSASAAPYTFRWTNIAEGDYRIAAVARDDQGEFTTSSGARLKVGRLPTYTISGRATDESGNPLAGVRVVLDATDLTIAGETTTDSNGNYRFENIVGASNGITAGDPVGYSGTVFGHYHLRSTKPDYYFPTAVFYLNSDRVIDGRGQRGVTPPPFSGAPTPPSVSLTSPATGATFAAGTPITLTADARDSDGYVAKVEFYRGLIKIGEDRQAPYSITWQNAAPGNYTLRAKAIDDDNATKSSDAVDIIVTAAPTPTPQPSPTPAPADGWTFCADENQRCAFDGTRRVRYGADGAYAVGTFTDGVECGNAVFGDPLHGTVKHCEVSDVVQPTPEPTPTPTPAPGAWTYCADEGQFCSFSGTRRVRYGASGNYAYGTLTDGAHCSNDVFGDPVYGVAKRCEVEGVGQPPTPPAPTPTPTPTPAPTPTPSPTPPPSEWTFCADEGQRCNFGGTREVRYGAGGTFATGSYTDGVECSNNVFGDPAYGVVKRCEVRAPTAAR